MSVDGEKNCKMSSMVLCQEYVLIFVCDIICCKVGNSALTVVQNIVVGALMEKSFL